MLYHKAGKKVFVTGANGFIGRTLITDLVKAGYEVTGTGRSGNANSGIDYCQLDLSSTYYDYAPGRSYDFLIHAASRRPSQGGAFNDFYKDIVHGTENVIRFAHEHEVKRIVYLQGVSSYGRVDGGVLRESSPHNESTNYGLCKYVAEKLIQDCGIASDIYVLPGVVGDGCNFPYICKLAQKLAKDEDVYCYNCNGVFNNVVYVEDIVSFIIFRMENNESDKEQTRTLLLGCSEKIIMKELVGKLANRLHSHSNITLDENAKGGFYLDVSNAEKAAFTSVSMSDIVDIVCKQIEILRRK